MSILNRDLLYSVKGGQVKFLGWASTKTTVGQCVEPYHVDFKDPNSDTVDEDPSDIMRRITNLVQVEDDDAAVRYLSGGTDSVNGGNLRPRVTIFTGNF